MKDRILNTLSRITTEGYDTYSDILDFLRMQVAEGDFPGELYGLLESS